MATWHLRGLALALSCAGAACTLGAGEGGQGSNGPASVPANPNALPDHDDGVILNPNRQDWLSVQGNHILAADGSVWQGRGVNLHDTRSCDYCTRLPPDMLELKRRVDLATGPWGATFLRLLLESYPSASAFAPKVPPRVQWQTLLDDPNYLHDLREIVAYIGTKPNVFVEVSLWLDPNLTTSTDPTKVQAGLPTPASSASLAKLATFFAHDAHVLFGVANEPQGRVDALQATCHAAMTAAVAAIRAAEDAAGGRHHIVAVQGTEVWARRLGYYVDHPIPHDNVVYETHVYAPQSTFDGDWALPAQHLPVIVGEFGPSLAGPMSTADCSALIDRADALLIPWLAWDFHTHCSSDGSPNLLLQDTGPCVYGIPLLPTPWGQLIFDALHAAPRRAPSP